MTEAKEKKSEKFQSLLNEMKKLIQEEFDELTKEDGLALRELCNSFDNKITPDDKHAPYIRMIDTSYDIAVSEEDMKKMLADPKTIPLILEERKADIEEATEIISIPSIADNRLDTGIRQTQAYNAIISDIKQCNGRTYYYFSDANGDDTVIDDKFRAEPVEIASLFNLIPINELSLGEERDIDSISETLETVRITTYMITVRDK